MSRFIGAAVMAVAVLAANTAAADYPVFTLATSEYPSWSTFIVAGKAGLVNPKAGGKHGKLEEKWKVDIVVEVKEYDPCLIAYANNSVDAVCMTNVDSLNPALSRASTMILPTSTSVGGDKVIGVGFKTVDELKGKKTYGLSKSVSEVVFVRGLQKLGKNPKDYPFVHSDPAAAALAVQTGSDEIKAICVWNPFALQTLRSVQNANEVFSSVLIPEEIIDGVVVANDALKKPSGDAFAHLVVEMFYSVCDKMANPATADKIYEALGKDFSNLSVADMKRVCKDTRFYSKPETGIALFEKPEFKKTMQSLVKTCHEIAILEGGKEPTIGYSDSAAQLNFETKYMKK